MAPDLQPSTRSRVVLGIAGGALCALGLSLLSGIGLFLFLLYRMFVFGTHWPLLLLFLFFPWLFLAAGIAFIVRALRNGPASSL